MNIFVPAALEAHARESGEAGTQWLHSLPERIAELEQDWGLRTGAAFDHGGAVSWVAPVETKEGAEAVLKIGMPHDEARFEAEALRLLDGQSAVRLLRASNDGFSLLLERCIPGTDLWSQSEEERDAVASEILPGLWRDPGPTAPFLSLTDLVAQWCEERPESAAAQGYPSELVAEALERGCELAASQPDRVLLHGDFHPGNVLAAQRESWLVIDPKPFVGDPAFDLAQWFYNRYFTVVQSADPVSVLRKEIGRFAGDLGLNPARIAGWTFVKALGWNCGPQVVTLFQKVAEA